MKVLWLASWYPNKISPFEGDFIQRHAQAVSLFANVDVIYVAQYGEKIPIQQTGQETICNEGVSETRIFFRFPKTGFAILDKLVYNLKYYHTYKAIVKSYFQKNGKVDLVHVHVPMKAGKIARWIKDKWNIPYIVSEHSATYVPGPPDTFENRSAYFKKNVQSVFRNAIAVTSVSKHDGSIIQKLFDLQPVKVIHNVVDTENFFYTAKIPPDKFLFIHISVMSYQKNIKGILNACAQLKLIRQDWRMELIGNDNITLRQYIEQLGLSDFVKLKGLISNTEVAACMQNASALVMFSRYENFPCVIIEALCCGLPVIATDVAGIPEAIDKTNGVLVKSENEDQLMRAMCDMINEYTSYNRINIAEDAKWKYNYTYIGKEFYELYNTVITDTIQPLS